MEKEGKRLGIFGASGSGKTTIARKLISKSRRLIVFDPKREWEDMGKKWLPLFKKVQGIEEFKKAIKRNWLKQFQIVYVPKFGSESQELNAISTIIYAFQADFGKRHHAKVTLFVDEAQLGVPSGTSRDHPTHGALLLSRMGRSRGINFIVASQRIKTVDINVRANLSSTYIFRQNELADLKEAREILMNDKRLQNMPNYDYFLKTEAGKITYFKNRVSLT